MIGRATCPDAGWWRDLLEGRLTAKEQAGLNRHLEACADCQRTLDALTAGDESWPTTARSLDRPSPPVAPALFRVIEALKAEAGQTTVPADPPAMPSLSFLGPPTKPSDIGRLGAYEVIEVIGQGGMGVVLKARDPALQRLVAIKVLAPHLATSAAARHRFQREGRATAAIRNDYVVAVHAVDEVDGLPYIVMEYVPGVSLQQQLDCFGPQELEEILRIGMQTATGLAAAHEQGLIHRDIKPANILLQDGVGRVKLSDFGLARAADDASLTQSGVIAGTPQYMAPEQARGAVLDHRADLFSLGSVLYALCTGRPPFRADTTLAVLRSVCEDTPHPIRDLNPAIPDWLTEIIDALHAKEPAERFQSADDVARLLNQHLRHLRQPTTVPAPPRLPPRPRPKARKPRRPWLLLVAVLLGVVALLGIGAVSIVLLLRTPASTTPKYDEQMVKLTSGRLGRRMENSSIQVDYALTHGSLPPAERYLLVVMSPRGLVASQTIIPAEIETKGTFKINVFISAPLRMEGDLTAFLAAEPPGAAKGQLQRVSNILPLR